MYENQNEQEKQISDTQNSAPDIPDTAENGNNTKSAEQDEGQSDAKDPSNELIMGKFKSVEDLSKAYQELQKSQGKSSQELGALRKELKDLNNYKNALSSLDSYREAIASVIERDKELYNTPEYMQNPVFKEIYSEAIMTFGDNLDTDRLINLLEKYVETRILSHDKENSAKAETQNILDSMTYSKNPKNTITPPKKNLDEMTDDEFKASLRKLI